MQFCNKHKGNTLKAANLLINYYKSILQMSEKVLYSNMEEIILKLWN